MILPEEQIARLQRLGLEVELLICAVEHVIYECQTCVNTLVLSRQIMI